MHSATAPIEPPGLARVIADWPYVLEPEVAEDWVRVLTQGNSRRSTRTIGAQPGERSTRLLQRVVVVVGPAPTPTATDARLPDDSLTDAWLTDDRPTGADVIEIMLERGSGDFPRPALGAAVVVEVTAETGTSVMAGTLTTAAGRWTVEWTCPGDLLGHRAEPVRCRLTSRRPLPTSPVRLRVTALAPYVLGRERLLAG